MLQVLLPLARRYAVYLTFPVALLIGTIGYTIERALAKPALVSRKAIKEERDARLLEANENAVFGEKRNGDVVEELRKPRFQSIFDKNVQLESRFTS